MLSTTFAEGRERNIALGVWGAVGGFGAAAGVLLGGVLTDALSWEWIFFVNIPVGVAAFVLAPVLLDESRDARVQEVRRPGRRARHGRALLARLRHHAGRAGRLAGRRGRWASSRCHWPCSPGSWPGSCASPSR